MPLAPNLTAVLQEIAANVKALRTARVAADRIDESPAQQFVTAAQKAQIGQGGGGASLPIAAADITEGTERRFVTAVEKAAVTGLGLVTVTLDAPQDGTTNSQSAWQTALDKIKTIGGGRLLVPYCANGYLINGNVVLPSNVIIEGNGNTLKKTNGSPYAYFVSRSAGATGYGSAGKNAYVSGLKFTGDFAANISPCAFGMHHYSNLVVTDCTFQEMGGSGHVFDLGACDGVWISRCSFLGYNTAQTKLGEAIQIDVSQNGSLSNGSETAGSHDGLFTRNVWVENNMFLPWTTGGTTYPAPNPIGSHTVIENHYYQHIVFRGNYVLDPVEYVSPGDGENATVSGICHFVTTRGLWFENNTFIQTQQRVNRVFSIFSWDANGTLDGQDFNQTGLTKGTWATGQACEDVYIRNNRFIGFKPYDGGPGQQQVLWLRGNLATRMKNVQVTGNSFSDTYGTTTTTGTNQIHAQYIDDLLVDGNRYSNTPAALYTYRSSRVRVVNNVLLGVKGYQYFCTTGIGVVYSGNVHEGHLLPIQFDSTSTEVSVGPNTWLNGVNTGNNAQCIVLNCSRATVAQQVAANAGATTRFGYIGVGTDNIRVQESILTNFTTPWVNASAGTNIRVAADTYSKAELIALLQAEYITYSAAVALSTRPTTIPGRAITVIGGLSTDANPSWFVENLDVRSVAG